MWREKEPLMPASAVPFIIAIVLMFSFFIAVVGGVSVWTYLPDRRTEA